MCYRCALRKSDKLCILVQKREHNDRLSSNRAKPKVGRSHLFLARVKINAARTLASGGHGDSLVTSSTTTNSHLSALNDIMQAIATNTLSPVGWLLV